MKATCHPDRLHHAKGMCASCHRRSLEKRDKDISLGLLAKVEGKERLTSEKREIKSLVEQLREANARNSFMNVARAHRAPPRIMALEKTSGLREMTAVALASDWHVEEPVDPEAVAYRNEYNLEIAAKRIMRFFASIIWNIEHHRFSKNVVIRNLVLWLGGDLITGYIHPELIENNLLSPTEALRFVMPLIRDGIFTLLRLLKLDHIEIPCSHGNHGRTTVKTQVSSGSANSFENLMYHVLAEEFRGEKRVHFEITASPHQYVQVYDFTLHFHHGDSVRYLGGVGGLGVPLLKAIAPWDLLKKADYHHVGHFHQLSDFGRVLVNGSLIGYGPYSQWIRAGFEPPQQMFYLLDSKRGKTMVTPLWVGERDEREAA
jgi:hypothetical protein